MMIDWKFSYYFTLKFNQNKVGDLKANITNDYNMKGFCKISNLSCLIFLSKFILSSIS